MFFFPQQELKRNQHKRLFETIVKNEGARLLGWRTVCCHPEILGQSAKDCMPYIEQAFIEKPEGIEKGFAFDRLLYVIRREFEKKLPGNICSLLFQSNNCL